MLDAKFCGGYIMQKLLLAMLLFIISLPIMAKDVVDNERLKIVISGKYKIGAFFVKPKKVTVLSYDSPVLKEALEEIVKKNGFEVGEMPPYGTKIRSDDLGSEIALTLRFEYKGFAEDYKPQDMPTKFNVGSFIIDLGLSYFLNKSINPMAFAGNTPSMLQAVNLMDMSVSNNIEVGAGDFSGEVKNGHRMAIYRVSKQHVQGWENVLVIAKNPEVTEQEIDDAALVGIAAAFSLKNK